MTKVSQSLHNASYRATPDINSILALPKQRIGTHSRLLNFPVPENELQATWNKRMSRAGTLPDRTAYIHIPFCRLRCLYCGFFKNYHERSKTARYVKALLQDIKMTAANKYSNSLPLHAVYFGGGTPGVMTPEEISEVLLVIKENFALADNCEITFETSLCDLDDDQLEACLQGGVNRFSLGVQTFDTKIRQSLGRIDNEKRLRERLEELCTKQEQAAIVIDLIYGLPGQTFAMWQYDLDIAVNLGIHGFDTYALNILPNSQLAELIKSGKMPAAAHKNAQVEYFAEAVQKLEKAGMRRLSICHWGRFDLKERNVYNRLGKGASGKIPFGSGAGGSIDGWRVRLAGDSEDYVKRLGAGEKPVAFMARPSKNYVFISCIKSAMDMGFISVEMFGKEQRILIDEFLYVWEKNGFINRARGIYEFTLLGQFWHGELTQVFLDFLQENFDKGF